MLIYAVEDTEAVSEFARTLNAAGVRIWFDRWELAPGHAWGAQIGTAITEAPALGVCIGQREPNSRELAQVMVARDARDARANRGPAIFPILLPGADAANLPSGLSSLQAVDLRHGFDTATLDPLVAAVTRAARAAPTSAESLGDSRRAAGDFGAALESYQLALVQANNEAEDGGSVALLAKLGATYADLGQYDTAAAVLSRAANLGDPTSNPDALAALGSLAETYRARGDLHRARQLQEQVLEASIELFSPDHPATLTAMSNLAGVLRDAGELGESRALQSRVLEGRKQTLGADHPTTLTAMSNLAGTLWDLGELVEARRLNEIILSARIRTLGASHPNTLTSMTNLAASLRALGLKTL